MFGTEPGPVMSEELLQKEVRFRVNVNFGGIIKLGPHFGGKPIDLGS